MAAAHENGSRAAESRTAAPHEAGLVDPPAGLLALPTPALGPLLGHPNIGGHGNGPVRRAAIQRLQQTGGNRATTRILQRRAGPGLPAPVQDQMEEAFQTDFSDVTVHADSPAADAIHARAYTEGRTIHFAPGQYQPQTGSGQELIGHELAHVVQQRGGAVSPTVQAGGWAVNEESGLEGAAAAAGRQAAAGRPAGLAAPGPGVQRSAAPVVQRAGDKLALTFEALTVLHGEAKDLQEGVKNIYEKHKQVKKAARAKLGADYKKGSENLTERQDFLIAVTYHKLATKLNVAHTLTLDAETIPVSALADKDALIIEGETLATTLAGQLGALIQDRTALLVSKDLDKKRASLEKAIGTQVPLEVEAGEHKPYIEARVKARLTARLNETYSGLNLPAPPGKAPPEPQSAYKALMGRVMGKARKEIWTALNVVEKVNAEVPTPNEALRPFIVYKIRTDILKEVNVPAVKAPNEDLLADLERKVDTLVTKFEKNLAGEGQEAAQLHGRIHKGEIDAGKVKIYAKEHARHHLADPIVQKYEKGYMESGLSLQAMIREWAKFTKQRGYYLHTLDSGSSLELSVRKKDPQDAPAVKIATVYADDHRFEKSSVVLLPSGETRDVFKQRESGKEYVQDVEDIFVPRHVRRALNEYDNPNKGADGVHIKADARKKKDSDKTWGEIAETLPGMSKKERDLEVWKHQRQKELQGGSPFVSTTTTKHDIFGATATNFESEHGKAEIDLAKIAKNRVLDTHAAKAYKRITGVDKPDPFLPFKEGDIDVERNSAARDAMRTRELVIIGEVPLEAIVGVSQKDVGGRVDYVKDLASGKFKRP